MRWPFSFILVGTLMPLHAHGGAWTLPEGDGQGIVTLQYSFASEAYTADGSLTAIEPFEKFEVRGYFEYGLTDAVTLVLEPQLRRKTQGDERSDGLGRVAFGGRARLWKNDTAVFSAGVFASAPGQTDDLAPLNGGDTEWEAEGRLLFGLGFELLGRHGFVDTQVGYRHRLNEPADEAVADLTIGMDVTERSFAMIQSFNKISVGSAKAPFSETQEHKLTFSTVYRLNDRLSFQAGTTVTGYGRSVLREQGLFVSLWSTF